MQNDQFAIYEAKCHAAASLNSQLLPKNKAILFDALSAVGIVLVTIDFDGSGDSGQFEELRAFNSENAEVGLPQADIIVQAVDFESGTALDNTATVRDYLETLACNLLESTHAGWEDGEGAYGQFKFSLADRTITLEYSDRYIDTHYHEHEF